MGHGDESRLYSQGGDKRTGVRCARIKRSLDGIYSSHFGLLKNNRLGFNAVTRITQLRDLPCMQHQFQLQVSLPHRFAL